MDYELRIIPECPNSAPALELFRQALVAEGAAGDVRVVQLEATSVKTTTGADVFERFRVRSRLHQSSTSAGSSADDF